MAYRHSDYGDTNPYVSYSTTSTTEQQLDALQQIQYWNALSGVELATAMSEDKWDIQTNAINSITNVPAYFS